MTRSQTELYEQVAGLLRESFGEHVKHAPGEPAFFVPLGRVGVRVEIEAVGEDDAIVECYCWIAQKLTVDDSLAAFLAHRNAGLRFAALCVDGEGAVIVRHALFAETLDKTVLGRLVETLSAIADELDEELRGRFG